MFFKPLSMTQTVFRTTHSAILKNRAVSYINYPIKFQSPYFYNREINSPKEFYAKISNYEHVGAEGVFSSLRDLRLWQKNLLHNKLGKNPEHVMKLFLSPGKMNSGKSINYGFGIELHENDGKSFIGHCGAIHGYTSCLLNYCSEYFSIIVLGNHILERAWDIRDKIAHLLRNQEIIEGDTSDLEHKIVEDLDPTYESLLGRYQNRETASIIKIAKNMDGICLIRNEEEGINLQLVEN